MKLAYCSVLSIFFSFATSKLVPQFPHAIKDAVSIFPTFPQTADQVLAADLTGEPPLAPYAPRYTSHPELGGQCNLADFDIAPTQLCAGGMASIFKALHSPTGKTFALKRINEPVIKTYPFLVNNEEAYQHDLEHEYIGKVLCSMMPNPETVYFVMPYYQEGNLLEYISKSPVNKKQAAEYLAQLLRAVNFLHDLNIGHFDLKPMNIMLTDNGSSIKLIDFGFAMRSQGNDQTLLRGSPGYMAPEIFTGHFGKAVDYYAIAMIAYNLFSGGKMPFAPPTDPQEAVQLVERFIQGKLKIPSTGDRAADEIIRQLYEFDAERRWKNGFVNFEQVKKMDIFRGTQFNPNPAPQYPTKFIVIGGVSILVIGIVVAFVFLRKGKKKAVESPQQA